MYKKKKKIYTNIVLQTIVKYLINTTYRYNLQPLVL